MINNQKRLNVQLIGIGGAGNKATINVVEKGVLDKDDIFLINSTNRDIAAEYREGAYIYNTVGGSGKDTSFAKALVKRELERGELGNRINDFIKDDTDVVVLTGSTEGGTNAGSIGEITQFIVDQLDIPVINILLIGFLEDARGVRNTIEVFQNVRIKEIGVQAIFAKKYLEGKDFIKAQRKANDELAQRIAILTAKGIVDSDDNIDNTDLYNTAAFPGYMTIEHTKLPKLKDMQSFNEEIATMINNSSSLDVDSDEDKKKVAKRSIFINLKDEKEKLFIDFDFETLKEYYGEPYDKFKHVQFEKDQESYISVILTGMNMPLNELIDIEKKYKELSSSVNKEEDTFEEVVGDMKGDIADNKFDVGRRRRRDKSEVSGEKYIQKYGKKADEKKKDDLY